MGLNTDYVVDILIMHVLLLSRPYSTLASAYLRFIQCFYIVTKQRALATLFRQFASFYRVASLQLNVPPSITQQPY